ncbi:MAG: bifunctional riboflavin kinase/FAD synthetase [Actinobacteria bacterium]|nr:bifunctional riboflavin kinase/FAD synthetase [Actinomycetota bacterium]
MKVYRGLDELPSRGVETAVTIGNFDGVHRGHLKVIDKLRDQALRKDALPAAITFDPHPQKLFRGEAPPALVSQERKLELMDEAGIERVLILKFDRKLSLVEPEDFIEQVLVKEMKAKAVVVGTAFRFGHKARGDVTMLRTYGRRLGFSFEGVRLAKLGGKSVSSTEVRHAIAHGDVEWAARALGRPHAIGGRIVKGKKRGKGLGFPTANLAPEPGICLPGIGIYAGRVIVEGEKMTAALSVGTSPTFGEGHPLSIEAHILDFDGDLYGIQVQFEFLRHLRGEKTFDSPEALSAQIERDVALTRELIR